MTLQSIYLIFILELYCLGFFSFLIMRNNIVSALISIEVMLLAAALLLAVAGKIYDSVLHEIFILFIIAIAAGDSAVGLVLLISIHNFSTIEINTKKKHEN